MSTSIIRGSIGLAIADFSKKALLAVTVVLCARLVPKEIFGDYMFLMTFYQIFSVIAGSGVPVVLTRDIARHTTWQPSHATASMIVRLLYAVPATAFMLTAFFAGKYDRALLPPLIALGFLMVLRAWSENAIAIFQAREDIDSCAAISLVQSVVTVLSTAYVCLTSKALLPLVLSHCVGAGGAVLFALYRFHMRHLPLRSGYASLVPVVRAFFRTTAWNNGATLVSSAYNRCDVLLLQRLVSAEAVAIYSAPYRILDVAQIIPNSLIGTLLPRISRAHHKGSAPLNQAGIFSLLLLAGVAFVDLVSILAPYLVPLILGRAYIPSVNVVLVLVWAVPIMFANFLLNANLIVAGLEHLLFVASTLALVCNLVANAVSIPLYGYMAAAAVTVFTEMFLLAVNMSFCSRTRLVWRPSLRFDLVCSSFFSVLGFIATKVPLAQGRLLGDAFFVTSLVLAGFGLQSLFLETHVSFQEATDATI